MPMVDVSNASFRFLFAAGGCALEVVMARIQSGRKLCDIEINSLMVRTDGAVAVDGRGIIEK